MVSAKIACLLTEFMTSHEGVVVGLYMLVEIHQMGVSFSVEPPLVINYYNPWRQLQLNDIKKKIEGQDKGNVIWIDSMLITYCSGKIGQTIMVR